MADQPSMRRPFTIKRVPPKPVEDDLPGTGPARLARSHRSVATASAEDAQAAVNDESQIPEARDAIVGARFASVGALLAFISQVSGARVVDEVACRGRRGQGWWAELECEPDVVEHIVRASSGSAYQRIAGQWRALGIADTGVPFDPEYLPVVELRELLAATGLRATTATSMPVISVLTVPRLGRWVLRRAAGLGLGIGVCAVTRQPLGDADAPRRGALLFRLKARRGVVPPSLLRAIGALPDTVVARDAGSEEGRLLVEIGHHVPLTESLLTSLFDTEDIWLLGGRDAGHWCIRPQGDQVDGAALMDMPDQQPLPLLADDSAPVLPPPLPVRLVPKTAPTRRADGVLVDGLELAWLARVLVGHPEADRTFLLLGHGRHLLLAPEGVISSIPFGMPVEGMAPGGLFVECDMAFAPPVPSAARVGAFGLNAERVLVMTSDGNWSYELAHLVPVWTLWLGSATEACEGLDADAQRLLSLLQREFGETLEVPKPKPSLLGRLLGRTAQGPEADRQRVLQEAARAQAAGHLAQAAELLEGLGEVAQAARLYERAALVQRD